MLCAKAVLAKPITFILQPKRRNGSVVQELSVVQMLEPLPKPCPEPCPEASHHLAQGIHAALRQRQSIDEAFGKAATWEIVDILLTKFRHATGHNYRPMEWEIPILAELGF